MTGQLGQSDLEDLSAYLDGQIEDGQAARIRRLVEQDPLWQAAYRQLLALDEVLAAYAAPAAPDGLGDRVVADVRRRVKRRRRLISFARVAAPIAAAAAVILIAVLASPEGQQPAPTTEQKVADIQTPPKVMPKADRFVAENLNFFRDYEVLVNYETLEAIERLEPQASSI